MTDDPVDDDKTVTVNVTFKINVRDMTGNKVSTRHAKNVARAGIENLIKDGLADRDSKLFHIYGQHIHARVDEHKVETPN